MTWIDGSRWDPGRGRRLVKLLAQTYNTDGQILAVIDAVALDREVKPLHDNLGARWIDLTRRMHEARVLRKVAEHLVGEYPVLATTVAEIAADPPEAMDNNPTDVFDAVLLFGQRPLIDRTDLRTTVREFLDQRLPLLVIRGQPRTGKSYSVEFLQHVTESLSDLLVTVVDFSPVANGDSAADLIAKTCHRLDLEPVKPIDDPSTSTRQAISLVDRFIGRYNSTFRDGKRRLVVIDGLNRIDLRNDVQEAVAHLAIEVLKRRLPRTQLVLAGHAGSLDPDLAYLMRTEDVTVLTKAHVRFYFQGLVLREQLTRRKLDHLVRQAQVGVGDVKALGDRVRGLTLELLRTS
jgi:hypothetical protein